MDWFRLEYGSQGAAGFISCQDPSLNFFCFTQNDIKSLKINNTITNFLQKIANTFNDYLLNVTATVIRNMKKITIILGIT
jgi:hypothetical protein